MKKSLLLIIAMSCLMACKKESNSNKPGQTGGTVVLSKIIDNTPGDVLYGKPAAIFTYNGTQLIKAVQYDGANNFQIDAFNYDGNGHLTGTTLSYSRNGTVTAGGLNGDVSSTVTYNGNNIAEIKMYLANNVLDQDIVVNYQNGNLVSWSNSYKNVYSGGVKITTGETYQYNSSNNNTASIASYLNNGQQYPPVITTNTAFDNKNNLFKALPLWVYFCSDIGVYYIYSSESPGTNNVLSSTGSSGTTTYSYQYDNNGYPTMISSVFSNQNNAPASYLYEYLAVN